MAFPLKVGDHPYIYKDSEVNFGDALYADDHNIANAIMRGDAIVNAPMNRDIVKRIAKEAAKHPACSREIQKLLTRLWL